MRTRIYLAIVTALFVASGCSLSADTQKVWITVEGGGQICTVSHLEATCAALPEILARDIGVSRVDVVAVSPEGCGENALVQAQAVADILKKAGFTNIVVVGFLTEPNSKCAT